MISSLDDLIEDMFIELPGCPEALIKQQLRLAARDFCRQSEAYKIELDPINLVADQQEYDLEPGMNASIARLIWVKTGEDIDEFTEPLDPADYVLQEEYTLKLLNAPSSSITDGLVVKVALRPEFDDECDLDPFFLERYSSTIIAGAKFLLMKMPKKPWSYPDVAMLYRQEFRDGINEAKREFYYDYKYNDVMMDFRSFAL